VFNMRALTLPLLLSFSLLPMLAVADDDGADPKALVEGNCVSCHGPEVYTRADRRVQSLPALGKQVRMCEQNLGLRWFDDQIDAVTAYLNDQYYQF
jgi:mono/diheme cytochrome c family protein